jgi:spore coat protein A
MTRRDRRAFLKLCGKSLPALALTESFRCFPQAAQPLPPPGFRTPSSLDHYVDPLPVPKRLVPERMEKGKTIYSIRMLEFQQRFHSQLPATRLWGYEGHYPGPTIEAEAGKPIEVHWQNLLPTKHIFTIDPHIHGAMPPAPVVRTVPHLHGSRTDSESDGLPEKWFVPGASARYSYPNNQAAATLWYHDHAVGITRLNVYAGLSGFYLLRDETERAANLPSGDYEIPLVLQDRSLDDHGQLIYAPSHEDGIKLPPGVWGPEFFGDLPVINGAVFPFLNVEPRPYRLRLLNGSNARFLNLFFNLARHPTDIPSLLTFHQIGTDGGLLSKPVPLTKLLLGPAERADLIVDFSAFEGKTVTLSNNGAAPFPGWEMMTMHQPPLYEWMQIRVVLPHAGELGPYSPTPFAAIPTLSAPAQGSTRDFVLSEKVDAQGRSLGVRINNKGYDDPVTEIVKLDSVETWRFINTTDDAHPMHLHLVQFQILHRQGFDAAAFQNGELRLLGLPRPPAANEAGWKDTAIVSPRDVLTIVVHFAGYSGRFVFHCHMLEHEDNDMMRPFEVVS